MFTTLGNVDLKTLKSDATVFIETGTNEEWGTQKALDSGFSKVISFENDKRLYEQCVSRFKGDERVQLIFGDSRSCMLGAITEIKEKMLFWLDGHNFYDVPLIEELEQIKTLDRNDHIILIDDVRMMDTDGWNLLKKSDIIDKIMEINSGYSISYIDNTMAEKDIMVASV